MRLISIISAVCLLAGCNQRTRDLAEIGYWVLFAIIAVMTITGLFALRRTVRALRQPDGHAAIESVTALLVVALPMWFIVPVIDDEPQWRVNAVIAGVSLYSVFLLFCFVLSVVRWVRQRT